MEQSGSSPERATFGFKAIGIGGLLSLCIATGAPYGNMVIRGSYMAIDFSTAGAIFLFFIFVGVVNSLLGWVDRYLGLSGALALDKHQLLIVYIMMIVASAIPTMGLSEYLLTIITGSAYYATPENEWANLIQPLVPEWMVPQNITAIKWFYEGAPQGQGVPWETWIEPLFFWAILVFALYVMMISTMVIMRKQWIERERLLYPLVQVPLEMIAEDGNTSVIRPFFRKPIMWAGFFLPVIVSSLAGLHSYLNFIPTIQLVSSVPIWRNAISLIFRLSFPMIGFSYLINLDIAFSLWFFNVLAQLVRGALVILGIGSTENIGIYGAASEPIVAHQGQGAMIVLVFLGLWLARSHIKDVCRKAFWGDDRVDDSNEMMSYRAAVFCLLGSFFVMSLWLWASGLPLWAAVCVVLSALLIFFGLTRIVVEGGVAAAVGPMIAPSLVVSAVGSSVLGPAGLIGIAFTYVWAADIRTFLMASCAHSLKLSEHLGRNLRPLIWVMLLAILISLIGSIVMILNLAYEYGGINLNGWFFNGGTRAPFTYIADKLNTPTGPNLEGWLHTFVGGGVMVVLMWARHHLLWWPLHPLGYPIGGVWLMDQLWFSIFLAWLIKMVVMKYGGPGLYRTSRPFFLGLIMGQFVIAGLWLIIDYFTGMTDNGVFWI